MASGVGVLPRSGNFAFCKPEKLDAQSVLFRHLLEKRIASLKCGDTTV